MYDTMKKILNAALLILGLLGFGVLCLPWYELNSSASVAGFASSMSFGSQMGFVAASTSVFGYGLYVLPAAAIGLAIKANNNTMPLKTKALCLELIGVAEVFCLFFVNKNLADAATNISGDGYRASAGFDALPGFTLAWVVYIATVVVGLLLFFLVPKTAPAPVTAATTSSPIADNAAVNPTATVGVNDEDKPL